VHRGLAVELIEISFTTPGLAHPGSMAHRRSGDHTYPIGGVVNNSPRARLVQLALVHALLEDMELGLVHHPVQPQQETIRMVGRVVHPIGIGQEHPEPGAQLEQLVPVLARAGQPAHLQSEDQADAIEGHFGQQSLEPEPPSID